MELTLDEIACIRIQINNDELQDLIDGERLVIDVDQQLQIEIYRANTL